MALKASLIALTLITQFAFGQSYLDSKLKVQLTFGKHLHQNQLFDEEHLLYDQIIRSSQGNNSTRDTLYFLSSRALFKAKKESDCIEDLKKISANSPKFYAKSQLLVSHTKFRIDQFQSQAFSGIKDFQSNSEQLLFAHNIMMRKFDLSDSIYSNSKDQTQLQHYQEIASPWREHKHKSALIAGLLSSAVPGLGKWYAGNFKQGVGSFLSVVFSGIQAAEGYRKGGVKNGRFIAFGILTSVFYVANIWGSAVSVQVYEQELYDEVHRQLAVQLSIDLNHLWLLD